MTMHNVVQSGYTVGRKWFPLLALFAIIIYYDIITSLCSHSILFLTCSPFAATLSGPQQCHASTKNSFELSIFDVNIVMSQRYHHEH